MKKIFAMLLMVSMVAGLCACGGSGDNSSSGSGDKEASDQIAAESSSPEEGASSDAKATGEEERTTFTVGFDAEFPPYGYMDDNGEYVGYDLSLAQEVCDRNGWELIKQPIDWDSKDNELNSGAIDCIWNGFTINGREDDYTWSDPYIDNTQVFVVSSDSGISSWDDLAGKSVLVQADSSALAALNDMPDLTATFGSLTEVADYNSAFLDMESGASDCVAMDIAVAKYQISSRGEDKYVILDDYISSEQYGIGFKLGNESLRDAVQNTLMEMKEDGTLDEITQEWGLSDMLCFGQD